MDDPALNGWLLAAVCGALGWWLGRQAGRRERPPRSRDYQLGLDHLLRGKVDEALRALGPVASDDADAIELQFALGGLFRKRGEVDRSTGLHERLTSHPLEAVRERARYELARDFLAAGLFDRAEQTLISLAASGRLREAAQLQLLRLYEVQADWVSALRTHQDLPAGLRRDQRGAAAHYLCELADQALLTGELRRVSELLDEAQRHDAGSARVALLRGRLAEREGRVADAQSAHARAIQLQPELAPVEGSPAEFRCRECGHGSSSWRWRCPRCLVWDSFAKFG